MNEEASSLFFSVMAAYLRMKNALYSHAMCRTVPRIELSFQLQCMYEYSYWLMKLLSVTFLIP